MALYNEGNFNGALAEFDRANALRPSPSILYNIGLTQKSLFRYDEAIHTLERYLGEAGKLPAERRAEVQQLVTEMRALLAEVTFDVTPAGATIALDGRTLGKAPLQPYGVAAGSHVFEVGADGYKPFRKELMMSAGAPLTVTARLERIPTSGRVRINATPVLADVIVDGEGRGHAPVELELPIGGHSLTVQAGGYVTYQGELVVAGGQRREVSIALDKPVLAARKARFYEKWYFWAPVSAVVVGAVAVGLGVGLGKQPILEGTLRPGAQRAD